MRTAHQHKKPVFVLQSYLSWKGIGLILEASLSPRGVESAIGVPRIELEEKYRLSQPPCWLFYIYIFPMAGGSLTDANKSRKSYPMSVLVDGEVLLMVFGLHRFVFENAPLTIISAASFRIVSYAAGKVNESVFWGIKGVWTTVFWHDGCCFRGCIATFWTIFELWITHVIKSSYTQDGSRQHVQLGTARLIHAASKRLPIRTWEEVLRLAGFCTDYRITLAAIRW